MNFASKINNFFLPLPPYSPDLNPIEQAWAVLKKKVTDLLREVPNIFESLERFFKTKWLYYKDGEDWSYQLK